MSFDLQEAFVTDQPVTYNSEPWKVSDLTGPTETIGAVKARSASWYVIVDNVKIPDNSKGWTGLALAFIGAPILGIAVANVVPALGFLAGFLVFGYGILATVNHATPGGTPRLATIEGSLLRCYMARPAGHGRIKADSASGALKLWPLWAVPLVDIHRIEQGPTQHGGWTTDISTVVRGVIYTFSRSTYRPSDVARVRAEIEAFVQGAQAELAVPRRPAVAESAATPASEEGFDL